MFAELACFVTDSEAAVRRAKTPSQRPTPSAAGWDRSSPARISEGRSRTQEVKIAAGVLPAAVAPDTAAAVVMAQQCCVGSVRGFVGALPAPIPEASAAATVATATAAVVSAARARMVTAV